ncbi:MAG: hypothetical protein ABJL57_06190 [Hyphomonas sp.]|uniref:hypothetical protein n=1 Tax=Hyphomonas sp. TaxID=87 RepID=UPI0032643F7E
MFAFTQSEIDQIETAREYLLYPQHESIARFGLPDDDAFDFSGLLTVHRTGSNPQLPDPASISQFAAHDPEPYAGALDFVADLPLCQLLDDRFDASVHRPHKLFDHYAFDLA